MTRDNTPCKTEAELRAYASEQSKTIIIRTYTDGSSSDDARESTEQEQAIIYSVIYGALLSVNSGRELQTAKDTAEYIALIQFQQINVTANCYDTIYNRIGDYF